MQYSKVVLDELVAKKEQLISEISDIEKEISIKKIEKNKKKDVLKSVLFLLEEK